MKRQVVTAESHNSENAGANVKERLFEGRVRTNK